MLNKVATRIQSRLKRKGLEVALGKIKDVYLQMVVDANNPTKLEINKVTEHFINNATQLTVITEDVEAMTTNEAAPDEEDLINSNPETLEEAITPQFSDYDYPEQPAPLATTTKNELVSTTAQGLGVVLNEAEIEAIATNVNCSSDDLQETLEEIKGAIIAFIKYRIANNSQKIDETLGEIVQVATDGFNANSQQLTEGLRNINEQLTKQSEDFKSKVKVTLKCFQIPKAS